MRTCTSQTAHSVVTNPERFHSQPAILACAWETLMTERGKRVQLNRLGRPAHIVKTKALNQVSADFDSRSERIRVRIRRHVAESGGGDVA